MKQLLLRILIVSLFYIFPFHSALAQLTVAKEQVVLTMNYSTGMEPGTVRSSEISKRTPEIRPDEEKTYPSTTGKPEDISKQIEYYYILDRFQFAFQNYCEGKSSREHFIEKVKNNYWNLADTIHLSRKSIRCGLSVLGGLQSDSLPVYIIDANNNNDYSDEVIRRVTKRITDSDKIISLSVPVTMDYFLNNKINTETINCYISSSNPGNQLNDLSFCFPAFRYNSFTYDDKPYILWTPIESYQDKVYLQAGKFGVPVPDETDPINIGQYVALGDKQFKVTRLPGNRNRVVLEGDGSVGFNGKLPSMPANVKSTGMDLRSSQVGFKAPLIQGIPVTNPDDQNEMVSLDKLKGKFVFIDFWSTTCAPCIADFPEIMKSYKKYSRKQFEIIGVVDERSAGSTLKLLKKHGITWPTIKTGTKGTVINGYDIISYPTTFLLDPDGKIIAQNLRGDDLLKKLETLIK